jgi:membrane-associated protein
MSDWIHQLLDPEGLKHLIAAGGLLALFVIVFAETGLLIGFFLPGDSLLFLAGALCSVNLLDPAKPPPLDYVWVAAVLLVASVLGNSLNYLLGKWTGDRIWTRPEGRFITRNRLEQAHGFYQRYGALSLVLTRFVPVARTFVPFIAGVSRMGFIAYTAWNVVGAVLWVVSLTAAGYFLGHKEFIQKHIEVIVLGVIAISVLPMIIGVALRLRHRGKPPSPAPGVVPSEREIPPAS